MEPDVVPVVVEPEVVPVVVEPDVVPLVDMPLVVPLVEVVPLVLPEVEPIVVLPLVLPDVEPLVEPVFSDALHEVNRPSDALRSRPAKAKESLFFMGFRKRESGNIRCGSLLVIRRWAVRKLRI